MSTSFQNPESLGNTARELERAKRKIAILETDLERHRDRLEDAENINTELETALSIANDETFSPILYEADHLADDVHKALSATRRHLISVLDYVESDARIPKDSREAIIHHMENNLDSHEYILPAAINAQIAYHRRRAKVLRESRDRTELELLAIHDSTSELMKMPNPSGQEASQIVATVEGVIRTALIQLREANSQATADDSSGTGNELNNSSKLFNANFLGLPELLTEFKTAVEAPVRDDATVLSLRRQLREAKEARFGAERDMRASKIAMEMAKLEANITKELVETSNATNSDYNHLAGELEECHQRGEERRLEIQRLRGQPQEAHQSNNSSASGRHQEGDEPFSRDETRDLRNLLDNYTDNFHQYQSIVQSLEQNFEDLTQTTGFSGDGHPEAAVRRSIATLRDQRDHWESETMNLKSEINKVKGQSALNHVDNEQPAELKADIQAQKLDIERLQRQLDYYRTGAAHVQTNDVFADPRSPSSHEREKDQLRTEVERLNRALDLAYRGYPTSPSYHGDDETLIEQLKDDLMNAKKETEMHKRAYERCMERYRSQVPSYGDLQDQLAEATRRETRIRIRLTEMQNHLQSGIRDDQAQLVRVRGMQQQVEIMQAEGTRNEDSIRNLTEAVSTYQAEIDDLTAQVTNLTNQLRDLAGQRDDLKKQLDDCRKGRYLPGSDPKLQLDPSVDGSSSSNKPRDSAIPIALPPTNSSNSDSSLSDRYSPSEPSPNLTHLHPSSPSHLPPLPNYSSLRPPPATQKPILPNPPASRSRPSSTIPQPQQQQPSLSVYAVQQPTPQTPSNPPQPPNTPAAPPRRQPRRETKNLDHTYRPGPSPSPSSSDDSLLSTPPNTPGGTKRQRAPGSRLREETRENKRRARGWGVSVNVNTPASPTKHEGGKRRK